MKTDRYVNINLLQDDVVAGTVILGEALSFVDCLRPMARSEFLTLVHRTLREQLTSATDPKAKATLGERLDEVIEEELDIGD